MMVCISGDMYEKARSGTTIDGDRHVLSRVETQSIRSDFSQIITPGRGSGVHLVTGSELYYVVNCRFDDIVER